MKKIFYAFAFVTVVVALVGVFVFGVLFGSPGFGVGWRAAEYSEYKLRSDDSSGKESFLPSDSAKPLSQNNCSKERKICADGSTVGRRGENCEFEICPQVPGRESSKNDFSFSDGSALYVFKVPYVGWSHSPSSLHGGFGETRDIFDA